MALGAEHRLQAHVMKLARDVIDAPHRIRAFDRSRDFSGRQHLFEGARGIRAGTPDIELIVGGRSINLELKAPGTKHLKSHQPSDMQEAEMEALRRAGAYAAAAWSCAEVITHWRAAGVPMIPAADIVAIARDAKLAVPAKRARR